VGVKAVVLVVELNVVRVAVTHVLSIVMVVVQEVVQILAQVYAPVVVVTTVKGHVLALLGQFKVSC